MEKKIEKNKKTLWRSRLRWGRVAVQLLFFLAAPSLFSQAFGGIKEILTQIGAGEPLAWSAFIIRFVILCVLTILFGRIFCGWMCAFGALGDWIYQFSEWLYKKTGKKRRFMISERWMPVLQKLKYVVLAVILVICFLGENSVVTKYSPWTVFSLLSVGNIKLGGYIAAVILFLLILLGMAVQERFFCQFLCPMGAVFSLLPELPLLRWKREKANCIPNCKACKKQCPVQIKLAEEPLQEGECIRCGRCAVVCPRKNIHLLSQKEV